MPSNTRRLRRVVVLVSLKIWEAYDFKICITNKAIRKSSSLHSHFQFAIVATWECYPLGNSGITYWKKHHHFKNCLHQTISKMVHLQNQKVLTESTATLFHFQYTFRTLSPSLEWRIEGFHCWKGRSETPWPYQKGFFPVIFKTKLYAFHAMLCCNEMNHFPNENEIIFLFAKERKKNHSKIFHQIKLRDNYLWTQGK